MRRGLTIFGIIALAVMVAAALFLMQGGWIRPRNANLETVLAEGQDAPAVTDASTTPGMQQQWVINAVRDATGRDLKVDGDFAAWFLPVPGIVMGKASLSNEQGFGDLPFASVDGLEMRVGSISPFDMEVEVERVALAGLRLRFARDAEGRTNWSDFGDDAEAAVTVPAGGAIAPSDAARAPADTAPAPADEAPAPADAAPAQDEDWKVGIDRFEIIDAEISLQDALAGRDWMLRAVDLRASGMRAGTPFPLSASFAYTSGDTAVTIDSSARTTITPDRWVFEEFSIASSGGGVGWLGLLADARLGIRSIDSDLAQSRAVYEGIELTLDRFDPEDLAAAADELGLAFDPGLLARLSSSPTLRLRGDGTVDTRARSLDLKGSVQLGDGSVVPLTIGGSFDEPRVEVDASR